MARFTPLPLYRYWLWLRDWLQALKPCRLSIIMVLAGLLFLIFASQGQDVLRGLALRQTGDHDEWQRFSFFASVLVWAVSAWYWAQIMLRLEFPGVPGNKSKLLGFRIWVPRLIGFVAAVGVAAAFFMAARSYDASGHEAERAALQAYAWTCLIGAFVFLAVVTARRPLARRAYTQLKRLRVLRGRIATPMVKLLDLHEHRALRYGALRYDDLALGTRLALLASLLAAVALFLLFVFAVHESAPRIGSAGILLLAAAGWIAVGSALDSLGMHFRVPVFTALLLLAIVFSLWNDNHAVRTLPGAPEAWNSRPDVRAALNKWLELQTKNPVGPNGEYPLFVVNAEGGGIRAAYWTATVLGEIQKQNPCFGDQLFASSGVSGGSLGAAVFTALLAEQKETNGKLRCDRRGHGAIDTGKMLQDAQAILGRDFLAPVVAGLLYPDLVQRVLPFPVPAFDRARTLEQSWERAWQEQMHNDRFAQPFDQMWRDRQDVWMPALLLNSTWVETGKRFIVSNLRLAPREGADPFDADFVDIEDAHRFFGDRALPLSTAVHLSARFTFVSPAGTLKRGDTVYGHAVDGGYFENSGATTSLEILKTVAQLAATDPRWGRVHPVVIHISNEPVRPKYPDTTLEQRPQNPAIEPLPLLNEALSPVLALANARGARGIYARDTTLWHVGPSSFLHFGLCEEKAAIPLGWVLSQATREEMNQQLTRETCVSKTQTPKELFNNPANLKKIREFMKRRYPQGA